MELGTLALLRAQAAHKLIKTLQAGIHWKGNVNTYADLPSSVTELDAYTVLTSTEGHSAGIYAYINNIWKFFLTCLELDQALSIASEKAISNKAVATKFNSVDSSIDSLRQSLEQASSEFRVALEAEATARTDADTALSTALEETKTAITEEITRIHSELENKSKVIASKSSVTGAPTLRAINIDGEDYNIPEGGSGGGVSQEYVDSQDQAILDTLRGELEKEISVREAADNNLTPYYINLSGTSGTLTDEQRETLAKGSPTNNFINKNNMLFKCVFYNSSAKAVYSISGESKIHVITVTLPAGTWTLVTYNLQGALTAGDNITIDPKTNVISATGGGSSILSKTGTELEDMEYTTKQLYYCTEASESFEANQLYIGIDSSNIDKLSQTRISTAPAIKSFSINPTSIEIGSTTTLKYTYALKKYTSFKTLRFNGTDIEIAASGEGTQENASVGTYTLEGITSDGKTLTKTANITSTYRQFFGVIAGETIPHILENLKDVLESTEQINTVLSNTLSKTAQFNAGTEEESHYAYFIVKSDITIKKVSSGGFEVPTTLQGTYSFTNHYDSSYNVNVYRTDSKIFGDCNFDIE